MSDHEENLKIKPIHTKEYEVRQSKYHQCGHLPIRSVIIGPSGSGKTVLLQNMILNMYKLCFERIYIFSPSINVDGTWEPVKHFIEKKMEAHETDEEKFFFDHYDPDALENIIATQTKIVKHLKAKGKKKLFQILIIVDDFQLSGLIWAVLAFVLATWSLSTSLSGFDAAYLPRWERLGRFIAGFAALVPDLVFAVPAAMIAALLIVKHHLALKKGQQLQS